MNEAILFCGALLFAIAFRVIGKKLDDKKLHIKGKELAAGQTFFRVLSVALPVLLHGAYDYIASMEIDGGGWFFLAFVAVLFAVSFVLVRQASKRDRYLV